MATLQSQCDYMREIVRNCPDFTLRRWLLRSAIEFCNQTRYLRETIVVPALENTQFYTLTPSAPTLNEVMGIQAAEWDGKPLTQGSPEEQPQMSGPTPSYFWYLPSKEISIIPYPIADDATSLAVNILLRPLETATEISDELLVKYGEAIRAGAMRRLLSMPGAAWRDPGEAANQAQIERIGLDNARWEADTQHRTADFVTLPGF